MADDDSDLEQHVEAAARLLDLPLTDAYRPGVITNLQNLRALYRTFAGFDEAEPREPLGLYRP